MCAESAPSLPSNSSGFQSLKGCPNLMGLTSVASQQRAGPWGDAPYTTRSRRRRSDVGTPGTDVCDSHCWGTTSQPAGLDALVHNVQARCARDPALTVVSLDAFAAYDGISRQAILRELRQVPEAAALLPFARLWLGRPSSFVWQQGPVSRSISQAEDVEQGDPSAPALFCLGLRPALRALQQEIREDLGERILAYTSTSSSLRRLSERCTLFGASSHTLHATHGCVSMSPKRPFGMRLVSPLTACKISSLTVACGSVTRRLNPQPAAWCCLALLSVLRNLSPVTSSL